MRIALLSLLTLATTSLAAQVVVTEVTYTHSGTTTHDSHYVLPPLPGSPSNWTSPVDYAHGTAVVRLEVFTKPTNVATRFQICFDGSPSYACTNQAPAYTTTGVYTWTTPFTSFYQYSSLNWSQGVRDIALILKDTNNGKPAPENVGATESAKYMPTQLRVTVTLVSAGSTYVPPADPDAGVVVVVPDAGVVVDAGVRDAGVMDAGVPDAGGVDAGSPDPVEVDAGEPEVDAGQVVVPAPDAGSAVQQPEPVAVTEPDAGSGNEVWEATGTGCSGAPAGVFALLGLALLRRRRRN